MEFLYFCDEDECNNIGFRSKFAFTRHTKGKHPEKLLSRRNHENQEKEEDNEVEDPAEDTQVNEEDAEMIEEELVYENL
jgi:hypothetical protein